MSFQALEWARKLPIPPTPKFLIMVIASYTDTDDSCFPALTTLAGDTRQSVDSVRRQVAKLQCAGLLQRYPRWNTGKNSYAVGQPGDQCPRGCRRTSDKIQLLIDADLDAAEKLFYPDAPPTSETTPVADCEGDGSKSPPDSATAPVATMVLPQEDSLEPSPERETRAREDKRPSVNKFLLKWPTGATDDRDQIIRHWDALPDEECQACLDGIDPFIAELKKNGRSHTPTGWKYIKHRSWELIAKTAPATSTHVTFDCWSRDWWAVLVARIERKAPVSWMVANASEPGKRTWVEPVADMPSAQRIAEFKSYPSDGNAMTVWRSWFYERGVKLPRWDKQCWVFLPAPTPPGATGPPPIDVISEEDAKALEYK